MNSLLFNLHNVPDDEAEQVRELLSQKGIATYETSAGRWQTGVAAIWLEDSDQLPEARAALAQFQSERRQQARAEWAELQARGEQPRLRDRVTQQPLRFLGYFLATAVILSLMTLPLIGLFL